MKKIPLHSLVITVGPQSDSKTKLLAETFPEYEIVSAESVRYDLVGDPFRQDINPQTFAEIHRRVALKLSLGERVVVDAVNLRREDRTGLAQIGVNMGVPVFYLVHDEPLREKLKNGCLSRQLIERQHQLFAAAEREILRGDDGLAEVIDARRREFEIVEKLPEHDLVAHLKAQGFRGITVVADVHGMYDSLLNAVSWARARGHFIIFLGDIIDYGRQTLEVADEVYRLVTRGEAELIHGNHEKKIARWLDQTEAGRVTLVLSDGNKVTTNALNALSPSSRKRWVSRFRGLMALSRQHRRIGDFLFVHAAAHPELWESTDRRLPKPLEAMAMYGEIDKNAPSLPNGYPNRAYTWTEQVPGDRTVIVGHDIRSTTTPKIIRNHIGGTTIFLDNACGKGGHLSTADIVFADDNKLRLMNFNVH